MSDSDIIRKFPSYIPLPIKPRRISQETFDSYFKWESDMLTNINYRKFINLINPITGRKMKKDGRTYTYIENKFRFYFVKGFDMKYTYTTISKMTKDEIESYILETDRIEEDRRSAYNIIVKHNGKIKDVIQQIKSLNEWDSFVLYNDVKYGLPSFYNGIHYEKNCMGKMVSHDYISCSCRNCENWNGNNCRRGGAQIYKCDKCNTEYIESYSKIICF